MREGVGEGTPGDPGTDNDDIGGGGVVLVVVESLKTQL